MFCMYFGWNVFEFFLECVFWKVCFVCSERYVLCFLCFSGKYAFYFVSYEVCFSNYQNRWGPWNMSREPKINVQLRVCSIIHGHTANSSTTATGQTNTATLT